jgi:flagellar biogenesis protein FliO
MDRQLEAKRNRTVLVSTLIALLVAAILLVITYLWLFKKLLA